MVTRGRQSGVRTGLVLVASVRSDMGSFLPFSTTVYGSDTCEEGGVCQMDPLIYLPTARYADLSVGYASKPPPA